MFHRCRQDKNAAWTNLMLGTVFHVQFPVAGNDVLRLFGCIGVPAEPFRRQAQRLGCVDCSEDKQSRRRAEHFGEHAPAFELDDL